MESFYPDCLPILIGSLPVSDHHAAVDMVFEATPRIPVWPQLPFHREEDMVPQFAPGIPGLQQEEDRMVVDLGGDDFETELASFYEDYLAVTESTAPLETSRFALSEKVARGFHVLRVRIREMASAPVAFTASIIPRNSSRETTGFDSATSSKAVFGIEPSCSWRRPYPSERRTISSSSAGVG